MDRLAYVAMSSAGEDKLMEASLANDLANANTIGFKADEVSLNGAAKSVRVYSKAGSNGVDLAEGPIETTGRPLDIAMRGNAWLAVTTPDGSRGYVHSASLKINGNGVLVTQDNDVVHSENGFSVTVPSGQDITIDKRGGVNVMQDGEPQVIDQLKIVSLPKNYVYKAESGLIQVASAHQGGIRPTNGRVVIPNAIEQSNVSPVDTLIHMMDLSRQYEADVSEISTAKNTDSAANDLLEVR
jgi:flagellar basal-body rod protein FlgF